MVSACTEILRYAVEDGLSIVFDLDRLSVNRHRRPHYFTAKMLADCLVPETNTKNWQFAGKSLNS